MNAQSGSDKQEIKCLEYLFYAAIFIFVVYQLYYIKALPYEPTIHAIVHLGFAMTIGILSKMRGAGQAALKIVFLVLMLGFALWVTGYFYFNYKVILADPSYPPMLALIAGVLALCMSVILVRWSFGWLFPVFLLLALLYLFFGNNISGMLAAPSISVTRAITLLASDVTSPWGLYGNLLGLSANYLFLFIVFGSVLHAFGGLRFVVQLGNLAASKLKSGPAALAIVSSALLGSVTGSSAANITITGSFTIPLMKKAGYTPEKAGAIEAASSNGGQFLPPVMGATVFVMAAYTGIPYLTIVKAALIPALMYFFILMLYAELNARKLDIKTIPTELNVRELFYDMPLFVIPLASLVVLLLKGYSLMTVVFWSVLIVIALGILSGLRKDARLDWINVRDRLAQGVVMGGHVATILAVIGVVVAVIEVTGLSLKLSVLFGSLAGDNLPLLLVLTMLASLVLGTGIPTPAAYVIVATVLSPMLIKQGLPVLQAHLFPMFYAFISHLTPPVGVGLLIASKLAGANYGKSAVEVFKAAFASLFLPFFFIYAPAIVLMPEEGSSALLQIMAVFLSLITFSVFVINYWRGQLSVFQRVAICAAFLSTLFFIFVDQNYLWVVASAALGALALGLNMRGSSQSRPGSASP